MSYKIIEKLNGYTLYTSRVGKEQFFFTAAVNPQVDDHDVCRDIYRHVTEKIHQENMHMVLERIFGNLDAETQLLEARRQGIESGGESPSDPFTFIQGHPIGSSGLAGIQIRAVKPSAPDKIWRITHENEPCGQAWRRNDTTYILIQNIHGAAATGDNSRKAQTERMFDRAMSILRDQGATYRHVVRTWIYLEDILDWYGLFNEVRNEKYHDFGLIHDTRDDRRIAEKIYLPASTGIHGINHVRASGTMDVFAIVQGDASCTEIIPITGEKQNSAFRYGSAFSRAMTIREADATQILVSGTASIDEEGNTVYKNDTRAQILKTFEVIDALIGREHAALSDIAKATVFLKNARDHELYLKTLDECGLPDLPAVVVQADVCRDDLLFELDAVATLDRS
ncbi:hypothetical protein JW948_16700 [bacterium]|nr:hypothetical protein [bacterium]